MKLGMMIRGLAVCCILIWATQRGVSNNVKLTGTVEVTDITDGMATLELRLSWENSWRDSFNWDAVWLFLKIKPAGGEWAAVYPEDITHVATNGYEVMNGKSGSKVTGVYVYPATKTELATISTKVTLKWRCGASYTKEVFDDHRYFLQAYAIEMVYVPYGVYYLGDGYSQNSFCDTIDRPYVIEDEGAVAIPQLYSRDSVLSSAVQLPAAYPKGYQGFYVMKYEMSQEQYVVFLNTLSRAQQESLLGAVHLSSLKEGDYLFGSPGAPDNRNGIVLRDKPEGLPCVFDFDLNRNGIYDENGDGHCVACNYLSVKDLIAYASWSGLRPMSELEYEKACRVPYPQKPEKGEYAWNSTGGLTYALTLNAGGTENEMTEGGANVNSGRKLDGPLRCGIFARTSTTQQSAGATYWGVMEMSGNLRELVANTANSALSKAVNGEGIFSVNKWSTVMAHYGVRGGSFAVTADTLLRVSDRTEVTDYLTAIDQRDSTVGVRLVQSINNSKLTFLPGEIALAEPLCPGQETVITENTPAGVEGISGMDFSYSWYVKVGEADYKLIPDATANTLTYNSFLPNTAYQFKRKAVCPLGEAETETLAVTSSTATEITKQPLPQETCTGGSITLTVKAAGSGVTYQWQKDGGDITGAQAATYKLNNFSEAEAGKYLCVVSGICGNVFSDEVSVSLTPATELYDPRDGNRYQTRLMADGREWMVEDLRFGKCEKEAFDQYSKISVQHQIADGYYGVCIPSENPDAGYLYNWQAVINHPNAAYGAKVMPAITSQWRGICPAGWHVPSEAEYRQLISLVPATTFFPGTSCDGWRGVLGGQYYEGRYREMNQFGYYYTTASTGQYFSTYFYVLNNTISGTTSSRYNGAALRCIKDYTEE